MSDTSSSSESKPTRLEVVPSKPAATGTRPPSRLLPLLIIDVLAARRLENLPAPAAADADQDTKSAQQA